MTPLNSQKAISRREMFKTAGAAGAAVLTASVVGAASPVDAAESAAGTQTELPLDMALHGPLTPADFAVPSLGVIAINRLGFGPRPGSFDISTFNSMAGATDGDKLVSFLNWQLNPGAISDTECDARLAAAKLTTLGKSLTQLWADHHVAPNSDSTLPVKEVIEATFIRGVYSKRQLFEKITAFWHNHFNVYAWDYEYASPTWVSYDRDVIRANAFGNFRSMLEGVATHPAMLYYLANYDNQSSNPNENWARELFELHTLGAENYLGVGEQATVPGYPAAPVGYVDPDVFEAARCFTGWRVDDGQWPLTTNTGQFLYYKDWHDHNQKTVLGYLLNNLG